MIVRQSPDNVSGNSAIEGSENSPPPYNILTQLEYNNILSRKTKANNYNIMYTNYIISMRDLRPSSRKHYLIIFLLGCNVRPRLK